jgi:hypothetical protein
VPLLILGAHTARFIAAELANAAKQERRNFSALAPVSSLAGLVLTADTKTL